LTVPACEEGAQANKAATQSATKKRVFILFNMVSQ